MGKNAAVLGVSRGCLHVPGTLVIQRLGSGPLPTVWSWLSEEVPCAGHNMALEGSYCAEGRRRHRTIASNAVFELC